MLRSITNALIRAARWIDALWGYDVFIAHRRADAAGYAQTLYDSLQAERISSFIDRVVYGPGDSLLIATRQHVAKSSLFLLLGSPQFLVRREPVDWVEREIETYLASHDDPKIIIVDFGDTIANALLPPAADPQASSLVQPLRPYLRVSQDLSALDHPPAEDVLAAIRRSLHGRSRDRRRLRFFQGIAAALALLLAVAAGLGWFARQQGLAAIDQRNQALINESQALAVQSFQATGSGDATLGALIALEGLPEREQPPHLRPLVGETTEALLTALYALAERTVVSTRDIGSEHPEARLSADGKYLLLRGSTNLVRDVRDGRPLASIKGSYDDIVEFDSDGETVVRTSEFAGVVRVEFWNIQTGALVDELHDDQPFTEAVVSPDGSRIITASDMAGHILIWDAVTRKVLITIPIPVMPPEHKAWHGFVFNFDGSRVAIRRDDTNELTIWDSKNGTQLHSINDKDQGRHGVSALNHDGSRYMIWQFELWNAESGTLETKLKGVSGPMVAARTDAVAFSPDGSLLAVRNDYSVSVFDGNDGSFRFDLTGFSGKIKHLAFGAKGRELVTTSEDGVVRLWNTETGALIAAYGGSDRDLGFAELGLDGQTLAFRDKKAARILDVQDAASPDFVLGGHTAPATMAVSPDNSLLATGSTTIPSRSST